MNQKELYDLVAEVTHSTKAEARSAVDAAFDAIARELANDGEVRVPGFGILSVVTRSPRIGRNPQTGEVLQIREQRVAKLKMGAALKEKLNPVRLVPRQTTRQRA